MNQELACKVLTIEKKDLATITYAELKHIYHRKALLYHPDKNKDPNAVQLFQEINTAYEYLLHKLQFMNDETEIHTNRKDVYYKKILYSFIQSIFNDENKERLFYTIIEKIIYSCEKTAIRVLSKLDVDVLLQLYECLTQNKDILHIDELLIDKIKKLILEKQENLEYIIMNPTIDDLLDMNLYKLTYHDNTYIIPLWHTKLVYDNSGNDICVKCFPVLPDNITIDAYNNIHAHVSYTIRDIWDTASIPIFIGKHCFFVKTEELKIKKKQCIIIWNKGIPRINTDNIYDVSIRRAIYIHFTIELEEHNVLESNTV